ncbi:MAG: hypothetical protein RQ715_06800 [Methylococcales bacterium]|nr:hypothetical protein [Methylococcales bacterium]
MFKKILDLLVDHPFLTALFITDLTILLFHRPPFLFSLLMFGALIAMSLYYGQRLSLFQCGHSSSKSQA